MSKKEMNKKQTNDEANVLSKEHEQKLKKLLCKFLDIEDRKKEIDDEYAEIKKLTTKAFKSLGIDSYSFEIYDDSSVCKGKSVPKMTFSKVKKTLVHYDIDKMKEVIGKKKVSKLVDKDYKITDFKRFKKIMERYDVPPEKIKDCITSSESFNGEKLRRMIENEELEIKDIKECYSLTISEYITHRKSS